MKRHAALNRICRGLTAAGLFLALVLPAGGHGAEAASGDKRYHVLQGSRHTLEERFQLLKKQGVMEGDQSGANLEGTTTRAQLAKVMAKLWGLPEAPAAAAAFGDLGGHEWARGYMGAAAKAGLFQGTAPGRFSPGETVTLEQLAAVLARAFQVQPMGGDDAIAQYSKVSGWAQSELDAAYGSGLIGTTGDYTVAAKRSDLVASAYAAYARKADFLGQSCSKMLSAKPFDRCKVDVGDVFGSMKVTGVDYWADNDEIFGYSIRFEAPQPVKIRGTYEIVAGSETTPEHVVFQVAPEDAGLIPSEVLKWSDEAVIERFKAYGEMETKGSGAVTVSDYTDLLFPKGGIPNSTEKVEIEAL
ncbi:MULTISPECIES: S-layer homology domain-containing protein [Paenibacillus]|uniref:S-layer homology domain-containing protein n=1 Tax=Paenibacillus TaxID=44249 RepID=UPI0022B93FB0|nr:S-layer homology domain-containing protein [Paenibacillus caseinilyticus]MCZ8519806.1 S-layer homology domain-containing protein [Paenibacillus caseinilyticus]